MRHINMTELLAQVPDQIKNELSSKQRSLSDLNEQNRESAISNGNASWGAIKDNLEQFSHRKCWYTESKNPGFTNDVDHFRPKAKKTFNNGEIDYWYWFLAFDPENYRLSCQFSNRLNRNPQTGLTGGKGDKFPLLNGQAHAHTKEEIGQETPVLLDPCNADDCDLVEFMADGRPVVSPRHRDDEDACYRVEQSKLLLNLDFPTFNEDREALYNRIKKLVERGDTCGPDEPALDHIKQDLQDLLQPDQSYSKAAECYVRCFRDRAWVEELMFDN